MKIGILFDTPEDYPLIEGPQDRFAEFEPESTIQTLEDAIRHAGHQPIRLGAPHRLLDTFPAVDLIWNIAEGYGSRNRESWGPVLAELQHIPCLGSDGLTLSLSLDKHRTKQMAQALGIPTAPWKVLKTTEQLAEVPCDWYPVFLKPRYEGTAKGISAQNRCDSPQAALAMMQQLLHNYEQDVLVEPYLPGAEYTVALLGYPLQVYPVLERALHGPTGIGIHAVSAHDPQAEHQAVTHGAIPSGYEELLKQWSVRLCEEMEVRHFARLDFKCDAMGNAQFLEINPLPTFAIDNTFAILAEIEGDTLPRFLGSALHRILEADPSVLKLHLPHR